MVEQRAGGPGRADAGRGAGAAARAGATRRADAERADAERQARERVLAAAADLFYARGVAAVGMDEIRQSAGVPLRRLYQCFPSKDDLVRAYLVRRDEQWLAALQRRCERGRDPRRRLLAAFSFLQEWFDAPDFRGCAFINAFGELGGQSSAVTAITRQHKRRLRRYLAGLAAEAGAASPAELANQLLMLMDGAIVAAAAGVSTRAAADARAAARRLLEAATIPQDAIPE